ncbi:YegP family protein [Solitalea lacus]|uniref:YegP family protein n=1 Tax=Solitalea lacus TaxID=2911172 RepID=UPI001EDBA2FD|nr:YegP family protein [Solitalea lacus]UKJ08527.1 YegP family protein [Solitalea lacus]
MGKFVTKKGKDGQFYFNLKADNGQVILSSEGYTTTNARDNGIESVRTNASNDGRFERSTSSNGKPYFTLKASNGQVIGKSELYESEAGRDNGIESVKKNAPAATVIEE